MRKGKVGKIVTIQVLVARKKEKVRETKTEIKIRNLDIKKFSCYILDFFQHSPH